MNRRPKVIRAIVKRELTGYFSNPTGYVFISLFVFLSAVAAFWQEAFFAGNLATLDPLNRFFPYLLVFFLPTITMGVWAEERKNGTDELLLTLPAGDFGIAAGKYLAALAIYTVALIFSLSHVVVLSWLGNPDPGLMASTYLGYWLMGTALLALGMVGSLLTANLTIAFIVGAILCAIPVFIDHAGVLVGGNLQRWVESFSFRQQFRDLSAGMVTLSSVIYFVSFGAAMFYLNVALAGRRHWPTGRRSVKLGRHLLLRGAALVVGVVSLTVLLQRVDLRLDVTEEQIHSLSADTRNLLESLDPARPVFIHAYVSPEVPRAYLETRRNVMALLREFQAVARDRIHARLVDTDKYTPEAREAQERYNIRAQEVPAAEQSPGSETSIFLGLAFSCGPEEFVIPFLDRGLPVEYELMRSIRVVSRAGRKKVGVLQTAARLFGSFNFETRRQSPDWAIVAELRKQYEVVEVPAGQDYPDDLDVLIAALPSSLESRQLERLTAHVRGGGPVLILVDPLPAFNPELSPQRPPASPLDPQPRGGGTDLRPLMEALGLEWPAGKIAWDKYNPHPQLRSLPAEVLFVSAGNPGAAAFNSREPVSSGLQEVVLIYSGILKPGRKSTTNFLPLLQTAADSGIHDWSRLMAPTMFGMQLVTNPTRQPDPESHVLAARVQGQDPENPVHAIVIADLDLMGEQFFQLRREGVESLRFDNVTFLLNAVDQLAGDESFIALRKRRPKHRTLEAVEARTRVYEERRLQELQEAERIAEEQLREAQARLDRAVEQLRNRADLDEQTRRIMIANLEKAENRRLAVARTNIEDEKEKQIERSRADLESSIRRIQSTIKLLAVVLPPIPAFLLFLLGSFRRLRRESAGVSRDRLILR